MLDASIRQRIDPLLDRVGARLFRAGLTANLITLSGLVIGLACIPLLAFHQYHLALLAIGLNRLADGLDGAIARCAGTTDFGGYFDIVTDFIFYSAVVFGMVLARPEQATYGAFLIFSFIGSGSTFLAFAIFAAKRGLETRDRGQKSFYYLGGLTEGFETITALVLMCLMPDLFWLIALVFGALCWLTSIFRIWIARDLLST